MSYDKQQWSSSDCRVSTRNDVSCTNLVLRHVALQRLVAKVAVGQARHHARRMSDVTHAVLGNFMEVGRAVLKCDCTA